MRYISHPLAVVLVALLLMSCATVSKDLREKALPEMVEIPAGEFLMGMDYPDNDESIEDYTNEEPQKLIFVSAFAIDRYEVTVAQYRACVDANRCTPPVETYERLFPDQNWGGPGRDHHPVNSVTWDQAHAYCEWAGKRLPTEAEFEKAARGTDGRTYPWGTAEPSCDLAVIKLGLPNFYSEKLYGCGEKTTAPVGSKPEGASPYGVQDMAGNVSEWTSDVYDRRYMEHINPRDPRNDAANGHRSVRGGNFAEGPPSQRTSKRKFQSQDIPLSTVGFRCAR